MNSPGNHQLEMTTFHAVSRGPHSLHATRPHREAIRKGTSNLTHGACGARRVEG